ncbi:MAG TPA: J domain-containing protein [Armatimonadetes bacterium]|nr:J domain-containing protein [Armatimonadota bacterium]
MAPERDYYEILEVDPKARPEIIEKAYRVLVRYYHPDLQPPDKRAWAEERMKELNIAYRTLRDPVRRAQYDRLTGRSFTHSPPRPPEQGLVKCYNHPKQFSVTICSECQRPICEKCAIEIWERVLCLPCAGRLYAEKQAATAAAEPAERPMGWTGLGLYYLLWYFYVWTVGLALFILVAYESSVAAIHRCLAWLTLLTSGAVIFSLANSVLRRAECAECGTISSALDFRRRAPWAEFWRPQPVCRNCGCVLPASRVRNLLWERLRRTPPSENQGRSSEGEGGVS